MTDTTDDGCARRPHRVRLPVHRPVTNVASTPRIGLLIPTSEPHVFDHPHPGRHIVEIARRAEAAGFDSLWAGESLSSPRFEPLAVLAALATATDHVTLGTAAMVPAYRQPVAAGQQLATIDRLAEGRLIVGVGAGYPSPSTQEALAIARAPYRQRVALLDEIVDLWRSMFCEQADSAPRSFHGQLLDLDDLPPVRTHHAGGPPVWLASATASAL